MYFEFGRLVAIRGKGERGIIVGIFTVVFKKLSKVSFGGFDVRSLGDEAVLNDLFLKIFLKVTFGGFDVPTFGEKTAFVEITLGSGAGLLKCSFVISGVLIGTLGT